MLRRAEDGEFDAVVFYRIDRLSREPMHHYAILAALAEAGVQVDSVGLPADDSPEGLFMWDLSAALAKLESLRLGKRLRSMHRQLAKQGKYGGNFPPYGWQRVRDADGHQRLVLDAAEAPVRRRMHEHLWAGWSLQRIADDLAEQGVKARRGGIWNPNKVSKMLRAIVQIGARVVEGEEVSTGRIEPLVSRDEYERTLAVLASRRRWPERVSPRPLRGNLVRCGGCGHAMYLQRGKAKSAFRCEGYARRSCGHGATIREHLLWEYVEPRVLARLASLRAPRTRPQSPTRIDTLLDQERAAREALGRLVAMYAAGEISEGEWTTGRAAANKRLEALGARLERARSELAAPAVDYESLRGVSPELWRALDAEAQHEILVALIDRVEVNPVGVPPRVRIFWR